MNRNLFVLGAIVGADAVKKADAAVVLEGDGYVRAAEAVRLFRAGLTRTVVLSGGAIDRPRFTIPAPVLAEKVARGGVPRRRIVVEAESLNTREQAVAVMNIIREKKWKSIILVASPFHQLRAYLTFLQAMREARMKVVIRNSPARSLPWFRKTALGKSRVELAAEEARKIIVYARKGHLVSFSDALAYERWKESRRPPL